MHFTKYRSLYRELGYEALSNYSPSDIRVEYSHPSVEWYLRAIENEKVVLYADYQRTAGLWKPEQKSLFIESLLMHLPITPVFLSEHEYGRYQIIDGLQRLSTLNSYVNLNDFELQGMEFFPNLNGAKFKDLPPIAKNQLLNSTIPMSSLLYGADELVKAKLFHRLNTSGTNLNPQEIRTSLYIENYFYHKLIEFTQLFFNEKFNKKDSRKKNQELVLKVISISLFGFESLKIEKKND